MRNLLGRLHARRLPELLRIADAWAVPVHGDSKGEVAGALYRAMTDPRTIRDLWERLGVAERAMIVVMADAPEDAAAPTLGDLAARLGGAEADARETALHLYRIGILAREGDDEPLPIGAVPRLLLPREIALHVRRLHDEMAAGDLAQAPLRVLLELLDDAELETAARTWGLRTAPGVMRRADLTSRLLRLVNDRNRVDRVVRSRSRDALEVWSVARAASEPVALTEVAARAGLGGSDTSRAARLRAALSELEESLLVWHAYRDGTRWLFVPPEIRAPGDAPATELPALSVVHLATGEIPDWRHADAVAWDLLTLMRISADRQAPAWDHAETPPRWLARAVTRRLWVRGDDGPPAGYLELVQALGLAEGVLAVDEDAHPPRIVIGPRGRAWRRLPFHAQTAKLRDRWLRLPRWVEGEPAQLVEVWGADWRGMRPRLLAALADPVVGWSPSDWVTIESIARRIAACYPSLLGPSFSAATARVGGDIGAGGDEREARTAALSDVITLELAGPFAWFGLTAIFDAPGRTRAISLTTLGAALATKAPLPSDDDGAGVPPLLVDEAGEITLQIPSPSRVWALSAFTEPVDLGQESHYRLTPGSVAHALANGVERDHIVEFLERGSGAPLPPVLAGNLSTWARDYRRVRVQHALVLTSDDPAERAPLLQTLGEAGWTTQLLGESRVLVSLSAGSEDMASGVSSEEELARVLRGAGYAPVWTDAPDHGAGFVPGAESPEGQLVLPGDGPSQPSS